MTRDRTRSLDERVSRLREATAELDEQNATIHRRINELEVVVDGSPSLDRDAPSTHVPTKSAAPGEARQEASDEDVANAVRAVERDVDEGATDACDEIIVV